MQGRVRWFDPMSRRGRLAAADGGSYWFEATASVGEVHGGDAVCFRPADHGQQQQAVDVEVTQSGAEYLNATQRDLLGKFLSTISIER